MTVLDDPDTFSNVVSQHLSVPNGMDPPEHTKFRRLIEPYFAPDRVDAFEPTCREIAASLVQELLSKRYVEFMTAAAQPFAIRIQCAFLGWPPGLHESIASWTRKNHEANRTRKNHEANRTRDRQAMSNIATGFQLLIDGLIEARRRAGTKPEADITTALMHEQIEGRPLSNAAIGILAHYLTEHTDLQDQLRAQTDLLTSAVDEILRIHGPLVMNRRITRCPVEIGGRAIESDKRISLMWTAANRDGRVFEDPESLRLDRDPERNLLYGAGIHVCPGAPLARMEMCVFMEELLGSTARIQSDPGSEPTNAVYPASGFAALPVRIT